MPTDPPLDLVAIRRVCEQLQAEYDGYQAVPAYVVMLSQLLALVEEVQVRIERLIDACEAVAHGGANHPDFTERCSFCEQPWDRHEDDCEVALSLSLARAWLAKVR